ncbi:STAS domain-containing protein [Listeria booriae]|uniref:STAS domain-containing protein n=1 Tax=Listeria booriae TaxID=1552123 RepID=A0A7X0XAP6_9LIST|nr:RsbT co-antagonist protein RsbRA [Listeria booriae]MBC1490725.1 STAS domain-containing protein [Listeria booriae]MBC1503739.1 STAS domain-containing protein [Listeria booriae]MBC1512120.1 STAS domain-containing protein [Listeria booriae]MBC1524690.1 STAS domain-containing protein [Listeria booriae]MBC1530399.1 STAS domain-containing protein [Listeria booriae]
MYRDFANFIHTNKDLLLSRWMEEMTAQADPAILLVTSDLLYEDTSREFLDLIVANVLGSKDGSFNEKLDDFAQKVVDLGWSVHFVTKGLRNFGLIVYTEMKKQGVFNMANADDDAYYHFENWLSAMYSVVVNAYAESWEKTVSVQKTALQELSAPLLPIFDGISVMPLIGTIDTERAKLIMENLLIGVVKHRSDVVLIDITGVPIVDTMVAHHIIQASDAVRLVGCQAMLVGIRPEIAQTIVNLGIELDQVITTSTMKKGMEKALAMTHREIVEKEE